MFFPRSLKLLGYPLDGRTLAIAAASICCHVIPG